MRSSKTVIHNGLNSFVSFALIASVLFTFSSAYAVTPVNNAPGVTLKGYDTVAYFTEGKPVRGNERYQYEWMGANWRFSSAENRDLFAKNPKQYAPQYGGYCAYAVSQGVTADIDPTAWKIVDGKLYLNLSHSVARIWIKDIPGYIAKADKNWPTLVEK